MEKWICFAMAVCELAKGMVDQSIETAIGCQEKHSGCIEKYGVLWVLEYAGDVFVWLCDSSVIELVN